MENEIIKSLQSYFTPLSQVTTVSKYLALGLFVALPFIGGYVGYNYGVAHMKSEIVDMSTDEKLSVPVSVIQGSINDIIFEDTTDFYYIKTVYPDEKRDTNKVIKAYIENLVATKQEEWKIGGQA